MDLVGNLDISKESIQTFWVFLLSSQLVPEDYNLFDNSRVEVVEEILSNTDNELKCIITGESNWI